VGRVLARMSRRTLLIAATLPFALAGCTAAAEPEPGPTTRPQPAMRLVAFDSCEELARDLRAAAKEAVGPWGFPGNEGMMPAAAAAENGARTAMDSAPAAKAATPAFSGTNVHEQGVDEPDLVKTDGRRIVTVDRGVLRVVDAASRRQTAELDLRVESYGQADLLLAGDRALVLADGAGRMTMTDRVAAPEASPELLLVDLAGPPRVLSRFSGDGALVDARQVGDTVRVVLSSAPRIRFPELINENDEKDRVAANRDAIDDAPDDAWLPEWTVTDGRVTDRGRVGCGQVARPASFSGGSLLTVHTFDLRAPGLASGDPVTLVADGDTVYGTPTSLYVANDQRWRLDVWRGRDSRKVSQETEIYRFDLAGSGRPVYAAAGTVPGWLVNQYALSEWDGHLRVATTDDRADSSAVRVLATRGDKLTQVGKVDGLGKGERIYSVRFVGPRGYLVTFRQTDPLYSVDLSDPAKPRVTGELKITGYSAHLQPAGDGRLIGIGQEADTRGRVQGTQVSLFDVSDPAKPRRLAQHHLADAQSEAEWDPHALLWWPAEKLLVVPIMQYGPAATGPANAALALRVTDSGIEKAGTVTQPAGIDGGRGWSPGIRRSLVIGDVLWTVSEYGLQASSLSTLEPIGWVPAN
jgi:uncharacterized secreted protein with C-terminal beta-propeller domain